MSEFNNVYRELRWSEGESRGRETKGAGLQDGRQLEKDPRTSLPPAVRRDEDTDRKTLSEEVTACYQKDTSYR
jgi:hypothetical protein